MAGGGRKSRTAPESPLVYTLFPFSSSEETKPCALTRVLILDYKTHGWESQEAKLGMIAPPKRWSTDPPDVKVPGLVRWGVLSALNYPGSDNSQNWLSHPASAGNSSTADYPEGSNSANLRWLVATESQVIDRQGQSPRDTPVLRDDPLSVHDYPISKWIDRLAHDLPHHHSPQHEGPRYRIQTELTATCSAAGGRARKDTATSPPSPRAIEGLPRPSSGVAHWPPNAQPFPWRQLRE